MDLSRDNQKSKRSAGIQSVEIGMRVLDVFAGCASALSLKQVCEALSMAPSKVHKYLVSFVRSGMLVQLGANGAYDLGPTARRLGLIAMGRLDAFAVASKELLWLRDQTGHTVCLSVWGDAGPTVVRWETGAFPMLVSIRVGSSLPLAESAIGRVFLAHMPKLLTSPTLKRQRRLAASQSPLSSISDDDLVVFRGSPSLYLASAMIAGIDAIASPVFDANGSLSSVICLLAPHQSLAGASLKKIQRAVEETARRVSYELGYGLSDSGANSKAST